MGKVYQLFHYTEDEFGNRRRKITKAEVRHRIAQQKTRRWRAYLALHRELRQWEQQVVGTMMDKARDEIIAQEDARIFRELSRIAFDGLGLRVIQGGRR